MSEPAVVKRQREAVLCYREAVACRVALEAALVSEQERRSSEAVRERDEELRRAELERDGVSKAAEQHERSASAAAAAMLKQVQATGAALNAERRRELDRIRAPLGAVGLSALLTERPAAVTLGIAAEADSERAARDATARAKQLADEVSALARELGAWRERRMARRVWLGFAVVLVLLGVAAAAAIEARPCQPLDGRLGRPSGCLWEQPMPGSVASVTIASDGRAIAAAAGGTVQLWDLSGAPSRAFPLVTGNARLVRFSPDGTLLAAATTGGAEIHAVSDGSARRLVSFGAGAASIAFTGDGKIVAVALPDHTVRLWDLGAWREIRSLNGSDSEATALAFSPDGRTLAAGHSSGAVDLWIVANGARTMTLQGPGSGISDLVFASDGREIVAGTASGDSRIWNITVSATPIRDISGTGTGAATVSLNPNGRWMALADGGATIGIHDLAGDNSVPPVSRIGALHLVGVQIGAFTGEAYTSAAFTPDGTKLITGDSHSVRLWAVAPR